LHELLEKIFCIPAISAPVERIFSASEVLYAATLCCARMGNKVNW